MTELEKCRIAKSQLRRDMAMMCFNMLTGKSVSIDQLTDDDKEIHNATLFAIELLEKYERCITPITDESELDEYIDSFDGEATVWIEEKSTVPGRIILHPATIVGHNAQRPEDPNFYEPLNEYYLVRESIGILWRAWIRKPTIEQMREAKWNERS